MATKLNGPIRLSRIPKELITKNKNGESVVYVDMIPKKDGADQYGNTHSLCLYNKETKQNIYLGDFKPMEFGGKGQQNNASHDGGGKDDLPW